MNFKSICSLSLLCLAPALFSSNTTNAAGGSGKGDEKKPNNPGTDASVSENAAGNTESAPNTNVANTDSGNMSRPAQEVPLPGHTEAAPNTNAANTDSGNMSRPAQEVSLPKPPPLKPISIDTEMEKGCQCDLASKAVRLEQSRIRIIKYLNDISQLDLNELMLINQNYPNPDLNKFSEEDREFVQTQMKILARAKVEQLKFLYGSVGTDINTTTDTAISKFIYANVPDQRLIFMFKSLDCYVNKIIKQTNSDNPYTSEGRLLLTSKNILTAIKNNGLSTGNNILMFYALSNIHSKNEANGKIRCSKIFSETLKTLFDLDKQKNASGISNLLKQNYDFERPLINLRHQRIRNLSDIITRNRINDFSVLDINDITTVDKKPSSYIPIYDTKRAQTLLYAKRYQTLVKNPDFKNQCIEKGMSADDCMTKMLNSFGSSGVDEMSDFLENVFASMPKEILDKYNDNLKKKQPWPLTIEALLKDLSAYLDKKYDSSITNIAIFYYLETMINRNPCVCSAMKYFILNKKSCANHDPAISKSLQNIESILTSFDRPVTFTGQGKVDQINKLKEQIKRQKEESYKLAAEHKSNLLKQQKFYEQKLNENTEHSQKLVHAFSMRLKEQSGQIDSLKNENEQLYRAKTKDFDEISLLLKNANQELQKKNEELEQAHHEKLLVEGKNEILQRSLAESEKQLQQLKKIIMKQKMEQNDDFYIDYPQPLLKKTHTLDAPYNIHHNFTPNLPDNVPLAYRSASCIPFADKNAIKAFINETFSGPPELIQRAISLCEDVNGYKFDTTKLGIYPVYHKTAACNNNSLSGLTAFAIPFNPPLNFRPSSDSSAPLPALALVAFGTHSGSGSAPEYSLINQVSPGTIAKTFKLGQDKQIDNQNK